MEGRASVAEGVADEEKGDAGKGGKSIAGSEYIQRRSAVRVWKFETASHETVLPKSQRESARDDNFDDDGGRTNAERDRGKRRRWSFAGSAISPLRNQRAVCSPARLIND